MWGRRENVYMSENVTVQCTLLFNFKAAAYIK